MAIIGIDLGTTNSACSVWKDGQSVLIPNRTGAYLTPSVIGVDDDDTLLVGAVARQRLVSHPLKTAAAFKRYMGSEHSVSLGGKAYSTVELSAIVLKHLKEDAESFLGEAVEAAVISVPAYFNNAQRKATKTAAELAGMRVERLINEPTAAAIAYGLNQKHDGARYIILDLGGGTFDVTLVEYFDGIIEIHASAGDNFLGGEDFLEVMIEDFAKKTDINLKKIKPTELSYIRDQIEQAKIALTTTPSVTLSGLHPKQKADWRIDRDQFEVLIRPLLARIQEPIKKTLLDADIAIDEIDEIVLVGGATRMPSVKKLISKLFRRLPLSSIDPDVVVAQGTGIQAGLREKDEALDDVVLTDVAPYSLGIATWNENERRNVELGNIFSPIIERNTTIPVSKEQSYTTISDNQAFIRLEVYQGESRLVKNNIFLGELSVDITPKPVGQEWVSVRFSYDTNGLLDIDVEVQSTGKKYQKTIVNSATELSDAAVAASREKLATLKFHPRDSEVSRLLIARAERLYESALEERRNYISQLISDFESELNTQDERKIKLATKAFSDKLDELEPRNLF